MYYLYYKLANLSYAPQTHKIKYIRKKGKKREYI